MSRAIMITGATGFIGQHLLRSLCENNSDALRVAIRPNTNYLFNPGVESYPIQSITANTDWRHALEGCETVIHLAARVHIMKENTTGSLTKFRRVNVEGTLNLARQAAEKGVKRFIFMSSIKVNGEATATNSPFKADDQPYPEDAYGLSKYEAEQGLLQLAVETGLEVVIIRSPLVYGPGVKGNFQQMIKWLKRGIPLPLGRINNNKRSFVSVYNLIDLIVQCVEHPLAANEIFLVSDGEDLSTTQLLSKLGGALDKPARLLPIPYAVLKTAAILVGKKAIFQRLGGSLQVDISKAREILNWKPSVKIDEALIKTVTPRFAPGAKPKKI